MTCHLRRQLRGTLLHKSTIGLRKVRHPGCRSTRRFDAAPFLTARVRGGCILFERRQPLKIRGVYYQLIYHFVWATRSREPFLSTAVEGILIPSSRGQAERMAGAYRTVMLTLWVLTRSAGLLVYQASDASRSDAGA